jgi:hypothetical protein
MRIKFSQLFLFGGLVAAFSLLGLVLNSKSALAVTFPRTQDVAIQGANADINDPYSHYRIDAASGSPDVYVHDACVDQTAGSPGLSATINGVTKDTNSNCVDTDGNGSRDGLSFANVPSGSILSVHKINGEGHQPFSVEAINATGIVITQRANPNFGSSAWSQSDADSYGTNVWGNASFRFTVPCSQADWTPINIKWKDADIYQDNQPVGVSATFTEYDPNGNQTWSIVKQLRNYQPNNNTPGSYPDFVRPGYHYTWEWHNVKSANVISHVLPFTNNPDQGNCKPPQCTVNCGIPGTASCRPSGASTAYINTPAQIDVTFRNDSNSTDWWIGGINGNDYNNDGVADYSNNPVNGNEPPGMPAGGHYRYAYPRTGNTLGYPGIVNDGKWTTKQHSGVLFDGGSLNVVQANPLNSPLNTSRLASNQDSFPEAYTVSSGSIGTQTYYFGIRNDETDGLFGPPERICSWTITWLGGTLDEFSCSSTKTTAPGIGYTLRFTDQNTGSVSDVNEFGGINVNTFQEFGFMIPHHSYNLQMITAGTVVGNKNLSRCVDAYCQSGANADVEPGQTAPISFGIFVNNETGKDFAGYGVNVTPYPGLVGTAASAAINPLVNNTGYTAYSATVNVRADYTGYVTADLTFGGAGINSYFPLMANCKASITPNTRPSLKVTQGDISSGGGFRYLQASGTQQCTLTSRRYFAPITAGGDESVGGIRTFAATAPYVSSAQFAAYALGLIHSPGGPDNVPRYGFFSDSTNKFVSKLTFANVGMTGGNLGGNLGGQFIDAHCAPDYFNETSNTLNPTFVTAGAGILNPDSLPLTPDGTGQFYYQNSAGTPVKIGGTLSNNPAYPRKRVTIFVNGDVLITNNITYGPWNFDLANKTNNSPYLTIIAKGNISVNFSVSRMDGVYIAQPLDDVGVTKGAFYSCSIAGAVPSSNQVKTNCRNSLSVNGSVIAQHVHLLRSQGTLQDGTGDAAENFNYAPSTVIGLPSFRPNCGSVVTYCIGSLNSLPPVF